MYCLIYKFNVKSNKVNQFKRAWEALTELIYEFEGSYGSRLHIDENGDYIAYAQWPSKNVFEMAGKNLPQRANEFRTLMKNACDCVETIYQLNSEIDLLKTEISKNKP